MTGALVLLRHGESLFNAQDRFAGRIDAPLTDCGRAQARIAGEQLVGRELVPDVVFTSPLGRACLTTEILLEVIGQPRRVVRSGRLAERHYGSLQGRTREEVSAQVGDEQLRKWRRGWNVRPPGAASESMSDVSERVVSYWAEVIEPELVQNRNVLVVSHGNTTRVLIGHLEKLDEQQIACLSVPVAKLLVYRWRGHFEPV